MELTSELQVIFKETAEQLQGWSRRTFMAKVVNAMGRGGQRQAEAELEWCRDTIRKGQRELAGDFCYMDRTGLRGRKPAEEHLPDLLSDMDEIAVEQSQTDPTFKTTRLYTRLSAAEMRRQLIAQKEYTDVELPTEETIRVKFNQLGYQLGNVLKSRPKKKIPETDDIFETLEDFHTAAQEDDTVLRISWDAKATIPIGLFSREGKTRLEVKAWDHDFEPDETLTPFGIFLPNHDQCYLYFTSSSVTSDFIVDCLCDLWPTLQEQFPHVETLLLNQDNGREIHSRRTQFMKRITEFADETQLTIQLAYYPPYHSKYNPVERVWGILEKHWNGSLLDSVTTVLKFAETMTWKGKSPVVKHFKKVYHTGVSLTKKAMEKLEERFERMPGLEKWFVRIEPLST